MAGTVSYDGPTKTFIIYDGEVSVTDMETAKGSAIADDDLTYIYTSTTKGIMGIQDGEEFKGSLYCGKNVGGTYSAGQVMIYGGGLLTFSASSAIYFYEGYGELVTYDTASDDHAEMDINECTNTVYLCAAFDVEYLDITNIKSGGTITLQGCSGHMSYVTFEGASDAAYNLIGVPDDGFYPRAMDLGMAYPGLFTESDYPDIDLYTDADILEAYPQRPASFGYIGIPGNKSSRLLKGYIGSGSVKLLIEPTTAGNDDLKKDLEYIHSQELQFLLVLTSHGDNALPNDILMRGRLGESLHPYNSWDFKRMEIPILEDT